MDLSRRVTELLAPGGRLAARWPRYEERPVQCALAASMAETMELGGAPLAERRPASASLAYLLPAVLLAVEQGAAS
jgi:hypothetical protein